MASTAARNFPEGTSRIGPVLWVSSSFRRDIGCYAWPRMARISLLPFVYAVAIALPISAQSEEHEKTDPRTGDHIIERNRKTMGTYVEITVWGADDIAAASAMEEAFAEFDRLDRMMTTWTPDSEMSRVNAAAGTGKPTPVSPELADC